MRFSDPFRDFDRLMEQLGAGTATRGGIMPMDAFRQDDDFVLRFDLPGVHPENVDLTVEDRMLTITAERAREDTEGVTWFVQERPHGIHSRQVRLGPSLDTRDVSASYDQGVLTVTIPVRAEAKAKKVDIELGSSQGSKVLETSAS